MNTRRTRTEDNNDAFYPASVLPQPGEPDGPSPPNW